MSLKKHSFIFTVVMMLFDGVSPSMGCEMERQSEPVNLGSSVAYKCGDSSQSRTIASATNSSELNATMNQTRSSLKSDNLTFVASTFTTSARRWRDRRDKWRPVANRPKVSVSDASVVEGDSGSGNLLFNVTLDKYANGYVNVTYSTSDGTATTSDGDYIPANGTITIAPGFISTQVLVSVIGDRKNEPDETFILTLGKASANIIIDRATATGTILTEELPGQAGQSITEKPRGVISHGAKGRPIDQKIIEHPSISGFLVLNGWNDIETSEGIFNWDHIDSEVARAKAAGKVIRLAIHAGGDSAPDWIYDNYPDVKRIIWYDKRSGEIMWIPAYWDPIYIEIKRRFYEAVGNRYKDNDTIFAMSTSMVNPNTGDWAFVIKDEAQKQSFLDAGFTEEVFISAYKKIIDYAMASFKNKYVVTAVGPIPRLFVSDKYYAVHQVLDYAYATYGDRLIIMKGALHAATPDASLSMGTLWETILTYTPNTAAQFVWNVTRDPKYKMNGKVPYSTSQNPEIFRTAAEKGKSYGLRWIEPWSIDLLNPDLQDEIVYAADLLSID